MMPTIVAYLPDANLGENTMRFLWPQRVFPFEIIGHVVVVGISYLSGSISQGVGVLFSFLIVGLIRRIVLNQELFHGLVKQVDPRVDDRHKEPADASYVLTEAIFGLEIEATVGKVSFL